MGPGMREVAAPDVAWALCSQPNAGTVVQPWAPRLGGRRGTRGPLRLQTRSARSRFTCQPSRCGSAVIRRCPCPPKSVARPTILASSLRVHSGARGACRWVDRARTETPHARRSDTPSFDLARSAASGLRCGLRSLPPSPPWHPSSSTTPTTPTPAPSSTGCPRTPSSISGSTRAPSTSASRATRRRTPGAPPRPRLRAGAARSGTTILSDGARPLRHGDHALCVQRLPRSRQEPDHGIPPHPGGRPASAGDVCTAGGTFGRHVLGSGIHLGTGGTLSISVDPADVPSPKDGAALPTRGTTPPQCSPARPGAGFARIWPPQPARAPATSPRSSASRSSERGRLPNFSETRDRGRRETEAALPEGGGFRAGWD